MAESETGVRGPNYPSEAQVPINRRGGRTDMTPEQFAAQTLGDEGVENAGLPYPDIPEPATPASEDFTPTRPTTLPSIGTRPGWKKSEGQLAALFVVLAFVLSFLGYSKFTPERIQNIYESIVAVITVLGPLAAALPVLANYIKSRGMVTSNQIWATASMNNPVIKNDNIAGDSALSAGAIAAGKVIQARERSAVAAALGPGMAGGGSQVVTNEDILRGFEAISDTMTSMMAQIASLNERMALRPIASSDTLSSDPQQQTGPQDAAIAK